MTNSELFNFILPFDKREALRAFPTYQKLTEPWEKGNYMSDEKIGNLAYIIRNAHSEIIKKGKPFLSKNNWEHYYLFTGKQRSDEISKNMPNDLFKLNKYKGRTLEELWDLSKDFYKDCVNIYKIKITPNAAFNVVIMKVFDDSYSDYLRVFNTTSNLQQKFPQFKFELLDGVNYDTNAIDVIVSKEDTIIAGLQFVSSENPSSNDFITEQKHDLFKMIYSAEVNIVHSQISGFINGL